MQKILLAILFLFALVLPAMAHDTAETMDRCENREYLAYEQGLADGLNLMTKGISGPGGGDRSDEGGNGIDEDDFPNIPVETPDGRPIAVDRKRKRSSTEEHGESD